MAVAPAFHVYRAKRKSKDDIDVPFFAMRTPSEEGKRIVLLAISPDGSVPHPASVQNNGDAIQAHVKKWGARCKVAGYWMNTLRRVYLFPGQIWKFGIQKGDRKRLRLESFSAVQDAAAAALNAYLRRCPEHVPVACWKGRAKSSDREAAALDGAAAKPPASDVDDAAAMELDSGGSSSPEEASSSDESRQEGEMQPPSDPQDAAAAADASDKASRLRRKNQELEVENSALRRSIAAAEKTRVRLAAERAKRRELKAKIKQLRQELKKRRQQEQIIREALEM